MIDQTQRFFDGPHGADIGRQLARDHDDLDTERASGGDLGVCCAAAAVLGDDRVDAMIPEEVKLRLLRKGAGRENVTSIGYAQRWRHGIDAADDIVMLRCAFDMKGLLPSDGEEDAAGLFAERADGFGDGGYARPPVAGLPLPAWATQGKDGRSGFLRGPGRILRNLCGEGMRRVDEEIELFGLQKARKSVNATEATQARRDRLCHGLRGPAGKGKQNVAIRTRREFAGQLPRFGRTAENEDAVFAHV